MPKADKDIAGKIVDFLRERGGETEIGLIGAAKRFNSHPGTVSHILGRLIERGIIRKTAKPDLTGTKKPARYALDERFKEGDGWREALKRKFSGGKAETGPDVTAGLPKQPTPVKAHTDDECLQYRIALSRDLVEVYKRLEGAQGQIALLQDEIKAKDKKIEDLAGEIEAEAKARKREVNELATLDLQLRELKGKTSISKRLINLDGNGVMIAKSEGLPDRT